MKRLLKWMFMIFVGIIVLAVVLRMFGITPPPTAGASSTAAASPAAADDKPAPPPKPATKWKNPRQETSAMDDSVTLQFHLPADGKLALWPSRRFTPMLVLECKEQKTAAYIETDSPSIVESGHLDETRMRVRFDDAEPAASYWNKSTDSKAYFSQAAIPLIKAISKAKRMRVEFTPFNASPQVMDFDVTGFGDRLDRLAKACKWAA